MNTPFKTSCDLFDRLFSIVLTAVILASPSASLAHEATGVAGGFVSGFTHPFFGWDHVVAMVAVGLWGAFLGPPAIWLLPIVFPLIMAVGASLGIVGVPIPAVEVGIAASAVVLGLLVVMAAKPPLWIAVLIVGTFAIFHGHAHGTELPQAAEPLAYAIGFVIATGLLHLIGILFGVAAGSAIGRVAVRAAGAVIAAVGLGFLTGVA